VERSAFCEYAREPVTDKREIKKPASWELASQGERNEKKFGLFGDE